MEALAHDQATTAPPDAYRRGETASRTGRQSRPQAGRSVPTGRKMMTRVTGHGSRVTRQVDHTSRAAALAPQRRSRTSSAGSCLICSKGLTNCCLTSTTISRYVSSTYHLSALICHMSRCAAPERSPAAVQTPPPGSAAAVGGRTRLQCQQRLQTGAIPAHLRQFQPIAELSDRAG